MSRQSGASFAQFFPAAPRVAKDRASEREKTKVRPQGSSSISTAAGHQAGDAVPIDGAGFPPPSSDGILANGSHLQADDHGSPAGEALNATGSASSHASEGSSVFSSSARLPVQNASSSHMPANTATPLTTVESPSHGGRTSAPMSTNMIPTHTPELSDPPRSYTTSTPYLNGSSHEPSYPDRVPARDPGRSRKGMKCVYDPNTDRKLPKDKRQSTKPIFKEFGLDDDDDAPPGDPRLDESGSYMGYINTDFHLPKSRLRHTPYNLKPYPYNPKTSIGPGPPTQIVVMGFNPLVNFAKVSQAFAAYGAVAESSNKLHPETGSYLGFATFRYKDAQPNPSKPTRIKAMDAARRAVREMHGQKIESYKIRVEFDPEGKKSRRMLEAILEKDREAQRVAELKASSAKVVPTGPKAASPVHAVGPPLLAPKGPAAHRGTPTPAAVAPVGAKPFVQPKQYSAIDEKPLAPQLANDPYIFVPGNYVPIMASTIPHMKKRLKAYAFEDIRLDKSGYYIIFSKSTSGRSEAQRCYRAAHKTEFFNYEFHMLLCLPPSPDTGSEVAAPLPRTSRRTPSPDRRRLRREAQTREDKDRQRRETEADIEEEKRQRAKNFDPVLAACEVVQKELTEHLIKHIRTRIAGPALTSFLDPANHTAKRRKLGIEDPAELTALNGDAGDEISRVGTPNSGADPIERRTGRLEVSALPRIRKAKGNKRGSQQVYGFEDPFARKKPPTARNAFRSLHHRLKSFDSDADSDDEADLRASIARETEEPESRPRSRMSTDDDFSKDDFASWGPGEEDSMTEASFVVGTVSSKKRKLDLEVQTAIKRQKKSDEELFGVTLDHIETDLPVHEISEEATPDVDGDKSRSETPTLGPAKSLAKKQKPKKKSKRQLFEEREAAKKQQQAEEELEAEKAAAAAEAEAPIETTPEKKPAVKTEAAALSLPVIKEPDLFSLEVVPALELPTEFSLSLDALDNISLSATDSPEMAKLRKKFAAADLGDPSLWLWRRNRVREANMSGNKGPSIDGYYVPNSTGCARTEGVKKILNKEKSKYLPHHIKVQKAREEREARAKAGKDTPVPSTAAPAPAKGNSRANRANNRRQITLLQDELKTSGDPDVFKFNQLKKRKKPVKFARSAIHNWGLYTEENINKDDMIIEYVGEQVRQQISEIREKKYLKQGMGSSYLFRIDDNTVIDATKKGGIARFINHSCMPNCTAKIIKVDGSKRIVIYALRDIARSEELTYDYKFEREIGSLDRIPCLCGTALCKGFLN